MTAGFGTGDEISGQVAGRRGKAHLQELDEEDPSTVHADSGILFPTNFDHPTQGVQLLRRQVARKVLLRFAQWVKPQIVLIRAHPLPHPSVAAGGGGANCRFQIQSFSLKHNDSSIEFQKQEDNLQCKSPIQE